MTQTIEQRDTTSGPQAQVDVWLADFEGALAARDVERAAGMFATDCYWRDLVSFTWNFRTLEGRDEVAAMLRATLDEIDPSGFRTSEEPTEGGA